MLYKDIRGVNIPCSSVRLWTLFIFIVSHFLFNKVIIHKLFMPCSVWVKNPADFVMIFHPHLFVIAQPGASAKSESLICFHKVVTMLPYGMCYTLKFLATGHDSLSAAMLKGSNCGHRKNTCLGHCFSVIMIRIVHLLRPCTVQSVTDMA